jgi:energy-coupling factor transport system permease protein
MLKDITLGQFFPGQSVIHRLDPRFKLILSIWFIVMVFTAQTPLGYGAVFALLLYVVAASRISPRIILKSIRSLVVFIVFTALLNVFFTTGETVIFRWKFIDITKEGVIFALYMVLRIVFLIVGTSMLTYTTSPIMLTDAIERLLGPMKLIKFPVHELAMMMTIALRFIPTLIEETDKIMSAQRARGADFESGNLIKRAKSLVPLLVPLFVSAFRRADELATAMECRCYKGGDGRTKYKVMKSTPLDYIALLVFAVIQAGIVIFGKIGV